MHIDWVFGYFKIIEMDSYERGESIPVTTTLTDGTNNLDTADFLTIVVKVKHKKYSVLLGSYSLAAGTVTKKSPTSGGQITFICEASETATPPTKVYEYQVTTTETDAHYEDNTRTRRFRGDCFYLKKALT